MNKCVKCKTEFEGNFCPNCGLKAQKDKTCPSCGQLLNENANFCANCGHCFTEKSKPEKKTNKYPKKQEESAVTEVVAPVEMPVKKAAEKNPEFYKKLYNVIKILPLCFFALFTVMLFIFYALPVANMDIVIIKESIGNVYSMYGGILSEIPEIKWAMFAFIVLAVFCAAYLLAWTVVSFKQSVKYKKIKSVDLNIVFKIGAAVIYLIMFIFALIVIIQISAADEGMGMLLSGACPIMITVFSALFCVADIGCVFAAKALKKKEPSIVSAEEAERQAYEQKERERKEEFYKTHTAPVKPQAYIENKKEKRVQAITYKHRKAMYDKAKEA